MSARCRTFVRRIAFDPAVRVGAPLKAVGPLARVLEVVDIVAEPREAGGVLDVVPRHAAQPGVLGDQPGDDHAEPGGGRSHVA